ncbi:SPASM domain-containing protein [Mucilaginibacter sp. SMC90]|uniref:radical SAM/SPASM domain-containing protein n=1 Tax=Mucilaginibacter sp. SMC90 TaxID=2929803 RepID=UPI001FB53163|nr:radical SAM protein [Mucilaginibacter sp. SMC90]UOE50865.1 SPASM domain-containing protein [Mucilaginibacter sp. SMC90]
MKYKVSNFNIFSCAINESGKRVLMNTYSGQTLVVSKYCHEFLLDGRLSEIPELITRKLIDVGAVVEAEKDELKTVIDENDEGGTTGQNLYQVIMPSAFCQLGCHYCGQQHAKNSLAPALFTALIDRIRKKLESKRYKSLTIAWFGGEPLLALNTIRSLTKLLLELCEEFEIAYSARIVTNGMSLKETVFRELTTDLHIRSIEVTLDGTREFHDQNRFTKEGTPSFDIIFNNLMTLFQLPQYDVKKCEVTIRCNVNQQNADSVAALIELFHKHEFQKKIAYFYAVGIYSWGNDAHEQSLTKEEFAGRELVWNTQLRKLGFKIFVKPARKKVVCMTVDKNADVYDAYGNIFNCTETPYVNVYKGTDHQFGHLMFSGESQGSRNVLSDWHNTLRKGTFQCSGCPVLPVCGGSCPKSWHEDMRACPTFKFNNPEKLLMYYLENKRQELTGVEKEGLAIFHQDKKWVADYLDA